LTLDIIAQIESLPPKSKELLDELIDLNFEGFVSFDKIELRKLLPKAFLIGYYRGDVDKGEVE
jgi:hypothetical protein